MNCDPVFVLNLYLSIYWYVFVSRQSWHPSILLYVSVSALSSLCPSIQLQGNGQSITSPTSSETHAGNDHIEIHIRKPKLDSGKSVFTGTYLLSTKSRFSFCINWPWRPRIPLQQDHLQSHLKGRRVSSLVLLLLRRWSGTGICSQITFDVYTINFILKHANSIMYTLTSRLSVGTGGVRWSMQEATPILCWELEGWGKNTKWVGDQEEKHLDFYLLQRDDIIPWVWK